MNQDNINVINGLYKFKEKLSAYEHTVEARMLSGGTLILEHLPIGEGDHNRVFLLDDEVRELHKLLCKYLNSDNCDHYLEGFESVSGL